MEGQSISTCLVCGSTGEKRRFTARETLFGTGEEFAYLECLECGSLQIREVPENLSRFYPDDYPSLRHAIVPELLSRPRAYLRGERTNYYLNRRSPLGWLIDFMSPNYFDTAWEWFRQSHISTKSRILDVGCGAGVLLRNLHAQGFRRLTGIDPHIKEPMESPGLRIVKGQLSELTEQFDFIMLHHSLEHMPDPVATLRDVRRLLNPGGHVLIRLPIAGTYAWERYGVNWIGLDPPRHIFVPTMHGMARLTKRVGFNIKASWFDSTHWSLAMSEKQELGLPGYDKQAMAFTFEHLFSSQKIDEFRRRSEELERAGKGDMGCFILETSAN